MQDYRLSQRIAQVLDYEGIPRKLIQAFTLTGTAIFWFLGLAITYLLFPEFRIEIYTISFVTILMLIPVAIMKHTIRRPRPDFKDTRFGSVAFDKWSFPSGHATRGTYIMILMIWFSPSIWWFWIFWGILILLSRLLLGVHYITDIIAGIIFSSISMVFLFLIGWLPVAPYAEQFVQYQL